MQDARERVLTNGGGAVGDVVTLETADGRRVTWTYVTDPEGNLIELQSWQESQGAAADAPVSFPSGCRAGG